MKCPTHNGLLIPEQTRYGVRWRCEVAACTVVCWGGPTSTPADAEVRALRHQCHARFDPLWQQRTHFRDRKEAYRWLRETMELHRDHAHIGMFDKEQCERLLVELYSLLEFGKARAK